MESTLRQHMRQLGSSLNSLLRPELIRSYQSDSQNAHRANTQPLLLRLLDVVSRTWYLGFTAFGGPPVHFAIFHNAFVEEQPKYAPWIDEQTYQDLFALCQSLPGPGSTKMLFSLIYMHAGLTAAIIGFFVWSLPAAFTMYFISLGISHVQNHLPGPVYALLSGLNAASVGIIFLAAVQLAVKASKDQLSRILVIAGGCAGLCYTSLWYFPLLIAIGGIIALTWDLLLSRWAGKLQARLRRPAPATDTPGRGEPQDSIAAATRQSSQPITLQRRAVLRDQSSPTTEPASLEELLPTPAQVPVASNAKVTRTYALSIRTSIIITAVTILGLIAILLSRSLLPSKTLALSLFSNMFLAGTIIFGGGPVVIPLLREYVVQPGWVSPRDFLIGLAVIQAMPGPNFNFAVYLGALALRGETSSTFLGAVLGFTGIFTPGLLLTLGCQSLWDRLRTRAWFVSVLRGVNCVAVGFVFTAVYRLWEIGFLTAEYDSGQSLANDPWWVVVAVLAYSGSNWFKIPAPVSILGGAVLGLCWYGVTSR